MKRVSPVTKGKSVKTESVKKAVEKAAAVVAEEFKQEKLAETVSAEPVEEKNEEKKTVAKKTTEKKATEKKAPVKKAVEKKVATVKEEVFVQFGNQEVFATDVVERVKNAYIAEGHTAESIEKVRVYIKPYYELNRSFDKLIEAFMLSSNETNDIYFLTDALQRLKEISNDNDKCAIDKYLGSGSILISHSQLYRDNYHPHYLVISKKYLSNI